METWAAVWLTIRLAVTTTAILVLIAPGLAWWLCRSSSKWRAVWESLLALPLILPPTVLGFYLLLLLAPDGLIGRLWHQLGGGPLLFSFKGLVIGSVIYSLPFAVQPLKNAFANIHQHLFDAALTLRATSLDCFLRLALPMQKRALLNAAILSFAHTIGEFGVVLMIGGNIPGKTQVLSIAIYEEVERLHYEQAHWMAGGLLILSFFVLLVLYRQNGRQALPQTFA